MTLGSVAGHAPPGAPSIGDRVFIGPHSVVVGGVAIGDDAMICAGSVVSRRVPAR